jgi:hypothetical protein
MLSFDGFIIFSCMCHVAAAGPVHKRRHTHKNEQEFEIQNRLNGSAFYKREDLLPLFARSMMIHGLFLTFSHYIIESEDDKMVASIAHNMFAFC